MILYQNKGLITTSRSSSSEKKNKFLHGKRIRENPCKTINKNTGMIERFLNRNVVSNWAGHWFIACIWSAGEGKKRKLQGRVHSLEKLKSLSSTVKLDEQIRQQKNINKNMDVLMFGHTFTLRDILKFWSSCCLSLSR
jgi:hypothetical protein